MQCLSKSIRSVDRLTSSHYNRYLKPHGLRITQYTVLSAIFEMGTAMSRDLEDALKLDQTTVSRTLKTLLREQLVTHKSDHIKRSRAFKLTGKGEYLYKQAHYAWRDAQKDLITRLGAGAAEEMLDVNRRILQRMS